MDVRGVNTSGCQLVAIPRFRQVRLAPQPHCSDFNGVFERQMLEGVEGVVVNEDTDGALRREQVGKAIDRAQQGMVR